jgi:hypothetical protein
MTWPVAFPDLGEAKTKPEEVSMTTWTECCHPKDGV